MTFLQHSSLYRPQKNGSHCFETLTAHRTLGEYLTCDYSTLKQKVSIFEVRSAATNWKKSRNAKLQKEIQFQHVVFTLSTSSVGCDFNILILNNSPPIDWNFIQKCFQQFVWKYWLISHTFQVARVGNIMKQFLKQLVLRKMLNETTFQKKFPGSPGRILQFQGVHKFPSGSILLIHPSYLKPFYNKMSES